VLAAMVAESLPKAHAAGATSQMSSLFAAIRAELPLVSGAAALRGGLQLRRHLALQSARRPCGGHHPQVPNAPPRPSRPLRYLMT
jgi:hypothetical protein